MSWHKQKCRRSLPAAHYTTRTKTAKSSAAVSVPPTNIKPSSPVSTSYLNYINNFEPQLRFEAVALALFGCTYAAIITIIIRMIIRLLLLFAYCVTDFDTPGVLECPPAKSENRGGWCRYITPCGLAGKSRCNSSTFFFKMRTPQGTKVVASFALSLHC